MFSSATLALFERARDIFERNFVPFCSKLECTVYSKLRQSTLTLYSCVVSLLYNSKCKLIFCANINKRDSKFFISIEDKIAAPVWSRALFCGLDPISSLTLRLYTYFFYSVSSTKIKVSLHLEIRKPRINCGYLIMNSNKIDYCVSSFLDPLFANGLFLFQTLQVTSGLWILGPDLNRDRK